MHQSLAATLLGIKDSPPLSKEIINKAFREKSRRWHPDVGGDVDVFLALSMAKESLLSKCQETKNSNSSSKASRDTSFHNSSSRVPLSWQTPRDLLWCGTQFPYDPETARTKISAEFLGLLQASISKKWPTKTIASLKLSIVYGCSEINMGYASYYQKVNGTCGISLSRDETDLSFNQITVLVAILLEKIISSSLPLEEGSGKVSFNGDLSLKYHLKLKNLSLFKRLKVAISNAREYYRSKEYA